MNPSTPSSATIRANVIEDYLLSKAADHASGSAPIQFLVSATLMENGDIIFTSIGSAPRLTLRGLVADIHDYLDEFEAEHVLNPSTDNPFHSNSH